LHEREWRCKGSFKLPPGSVAALVRNTYDAKRLAEQIEKKRKKIKCIPRSIIPLSVVCQGFLHE
jgi:hypothetical protein